MYVQQRVFILTRHEQPSTSSSYGKLGTLVQRMPKKIPIQKRLKQSHKAAPWQWKSNELP